MKYYQCDITNEDDELAFNEIVKEYGGVDVLISNAGVAIHSSLGNLTQKFR